MDVRPIERSVLNAPQFHLCFVCYEKVNGFWARITGPFLRQSWTSNACFKKGGIANLTNEYFKLLGTSEVSFRHLKKLQLLSAT